MEDQLKICRLCFKLICKNDYRSMEDELVMVTAIFLDLVNWKYSKNPLLCYECVENLQQSYDFKSTCQMSEEQIYTASSCKQGDVDLWQIRNGSESEEFRENKKICRCCLNLNEKDEYFQLEEEDSIHLMLQKCLPELDLFMVREPVICLNCFDALKSLFNFIESCLNVEESINMYRDTESSGNNDIVNLYNVLQFTKIEKKCDVDEAYSKEFVIEQEIETVVKFENSEDEKFETKPEVILKTEPLDFEEECETSVKIEHFENQTETGELRRPEGGDILTQLGLTTSLRTTQQYVMVNFEEDLSKSCVKQMMGNENVSTVPTYRCECCSFWTLYRDTFQMHLLQHMDPSETKRRADLKNHLLKHEEPSEVTIFKCDSCSYQTYHKDYLKKHFLKHKDPSEIRMFKCDTCSFQTKYGSSLKLHSLVHKDLSEVTKYKCEFCSYQTRYKVHLKKHLLRHKEVTMFKCDFCSYQTKRGVHLKRHLLIHKEPSEVTLIKCDFCSYQTNHKDNLRKHFLKHKEPSEIIMFKCDYCSFQSRYKDSLKNHLPRHRDHPQVTVYQCKCCLYQTNRRKRFEQHSLKHKELSEVTMFKCDTCSFQTKYKESLKRHSLKHKEPLEITVFKCDSCSYQTNHKDNLRKHLLRMHMEPS